MVGTDIIEVARIEKLIKEKGDKFLNKIYQPIEIEYCESKGPNKYQHYAGRFAAKEAVLKALARKNGNVSSFVTFKSIAIHNRNDGAPYVDLAVVSVEGDLDFGSRIDISISHIKKYATAVAIVKYD